MSLDPSNTVLAVGSIDGYITFWDLRLGHHLFTINAFSPILTLEFRPVESANRELVLMSTCSDGYAKFWCVDLQRRTWSPTPIKYHCKSLARDEIRCASFSPAGFRFITGATDGIVRLFNVPDVTDVKSGAQPPNLLPYVHYLEEHEGYVNSVHFSSSGTRFVTSSWDGHVREWHYEKTFWTSEAFSTSAVLGDSRDEVVIGRPRKVTIVTYCCNDEALVGAVSQSFELILFDAKKRRKGIPLHYHTGEVYILTASPIDDRIVLSAGCDGQAALWNMQTGQRIFEFSLPNTRFLDGSFSHDGSMFALVDDLGRVSVFGCGISPDTYQHAPASQFFPTDWNELIFDTQRNAVDAITQRPPHLVPRDMIVSIEKAAFGPIVSESYALTIPIEGDPVLAAKQQQLFQRQYEAERRLWKAEVENTPPDTMPRHARSRRRRLLYGSDVEEEVPFLNGTATNRSTIAANGDADDEPFQMASGSETDAELSVTGSEEEQETPGPYNLRRRHTVETPSPRTPRHTLRGERQRIHAELAEEDDQLYRPTYHSPRSIPRRRRRTVIPDSDEDIVPTVEPSPWFTTQDRQVFPYLPQIYDAVAYFTEGHRLFLSKEPGAQFHEDLPWETERHLDRVVFGQIISLQIFPGPPAWCALELLLLSREQIRENLPPPTHIPPSSSRIRITYYDMEGQPDFIIPFCRYAWSVAPVQRYGVDEIVRVVFGRSEAYEARIKKIKVPTDRIPERPWQCYQVEWLSLDDPPEYLSPWELETIFNEDVPERQIYECEEHINTDVLRAIDEGLQELLCDPRAVAFKRSVDLRLFPDYLEEVAYPMDLTLLSRRIQNGYYRRVAALEWDARLIHENAYNYNLPDSEIVQDASYVVEGIIRIIKRAERGTRRSVRHSESSQSRQNIRRLESPQNETVSRGRAEREERARRRARLDLTRIATNFTPSTGNNRPTRSRVVTTVDTASSSASPATRSKHHRHEYLDTESNDDDDEETVSGAIIRQSRRQAKRPRREYLESESDDEDPGSGIAFRQLRLETGQHRSSTNSTSSPSTSRPRRSTAHYI
jgi:WD40 repeat protein